MHQWLADNRDADLVDLCMQCLRLETGVHHTNAATDIAHEVIEEILDKRGLLSDERKLIKKLAAAR